MLDRPYQSTKAAIAAAANFSRPLDLPASSSSIRVDSAPSGEGLGRPIAVRAALTRAGIDTRGGRAGQSRPMATPDLPAAAAANEAFLNLTDTANIAAVRGRSLTDFLARGAVDLRVLLDNVKRTGQLRLYATRLTTDFMGQIAVEISATWLNDRPSPVLVLVVRDASRVETLRRPAFGQPDDGVRNVMELVGSSTLKDIVAETTDVIEKMCIETALELTRNNRVAAADMLGLSRQSLYVKLRKYGLLNKDGD
jgi:hypothetical protein